MGSVFRGEEVRSATPRHALIFAALLGIACTAEGGHTVGADPDADVAGIRDSGADGYEPLWDPPLDFLPSNAGTLGGDLSGVGDVVISAGDCELLTEQGLWTCVDPSDYVHRFVELPSGWKYSVFIVKSLRLEPGALVQTREAPPTILVALDDMTLEGSILVVPGTSGGHINSLAAESGAGPGGGQPGGDTSSGGGASYCGLGGSGAAKPGAGVGVMPASYGPPELAPLVGGSAGGSAAAGSAGSGGGAIQLIAGGTFTLGPAAFVSAGGGGGRAGSLATQMGGAGAGSGGSILIEAPTVSLRGTLAANGGGGGQGVGDDGEDGHATANPALGGALMIDGAITAPGGNGSAGELTSGSDGVAAGFENPSGGGGGAGRIRINTHSGTADLQGAIVTPAPSTPCVTIGTLE